MSIFTDLRDSLFPSICPGCRSNLLPEHAFFCVACSYACPFTDFHRLSENNAMDRIGGRAKFLHGASLFRFYPEGRVHRLIHEIKYGGRWKLAEKVGYAYATLLLEEGNLWSSHPIIVPVPLHKSRIRSRGYNQSDHLGKGLSSRTGWALRSSTLRRVINTPSQTKLTRLQRQENLEQAFALKNPERIKGQDILLVDDILTTGATLEACYHTLLQGNPSSISFATIGLAFS